MMILIPTRHEVENQSFGSLNVLNSMLVWVFINFNQIFQLLIQESFFILLDFYFSLYGLQAFTISFYMGSMFSVFKLE